MTDRPTASSVSCPVGVAGRLLRGSISMFLVAFAVSMLPSDPVIAISVGTLSIAVAFSAVTGRCPIGLSTLRHRPKVSPNSLGFPDASGQLDLVQTLTRPKGPRVHE